MWTCVDICVDIWMCRYLQCRYPGADVHPDHVPGLGGPGGHGAAAAEAPDLHPAGPHP